MTVRLKKIIRDWVRIAASLMLVMSTACSDNHIEDISLEDDMINVNITINLMAQSTTRAVEDGGLDYDTSLQRIISPEDIYLIFYNTDGTIALVPDIEPLAGSHDSPVRTLKTRMPQVDSYMSFRILANVASASSIGSTPDEVRTYLLDMADKGKSDTDLIQALYADAFDDKGIWPLNASGNYLPMHTPMSDPISFDHDISLNTNLYRSLAKIGVEYVEADAPFIIDRVYVVNQHQRASILSPYLPSSNPSKQYSQPYVLDTALRTENTLYSLSAGESSLLEQVFVPEHINTGNPDTDIYLRVEGHFIDRTKTYRYDIYFTDNGHLPASDANLSYNVIRNYSYIFRIKEITGPLIDVELVVNPSWAEVHELQFDD